MSIGDFAKVICNSKGNLKIYYVEVRMLSEVI